MFKIAFIQWLILLLFCRSAPYQIFIYEVVSCAQCSPRPACPLKGAHLMQVHDLPQGAPVLALAGVIQVLCGCEFFTKIITRSRVRPESDGR